MEALTCTQVNMVKEWSGFKVWMNKVDVEVKDRDGKIYSVQQSLSDPIQVS